MADSIQLFVVDVDGTLLAPEKRLTDRVRDPVRSLRQAGVQLALTSGRPPRPLALPRLPTVLQDHAAQS
jgi:hypothetical protein